MEFLDDEDDGTAETNFRRLARFPNSRHSSAIILSPQSEVIELWRTGQCAPSVPSIFIPLNLLNKLAGNNLEYNSASICSSQVCHHIFSSIDLVNNRKENAILFDSLKVGQDLIHEELSSISKHHPALSALSSFKSRASLTDFESIVSTVSGLYGMMNFLIRTRNMIQHMQTNLVEILSEPVSYCGMKMYVAYPIIMVNLAKHTRTLFLINYDQLLMMTDTITSRFLTAIACLLNEVLRVDDLPPWDIVRNIYRWGDRMLETYGDKSYAIIGMFEDIVTNSFVNFPGSDPLGLGKPFTLTLFNDAKNIKDEYGIDEQEVKSLINILGEVSSVNWLSEIFGLRKHWGNPIVSPVESGKAILDIMAEELPVSGVGLINLQASFNRMIILEFIKQNGEWPLGTFLLSKQFPTYPLQQAHITKTVRLPEASPGHHHFHWALFVFQPNCVLDTFANPLEIISDKSISFYRSNLDLVYVQKLRKDKMKRRQAKEQRRLLLEFLRTKHPSITEIFSVIMSGEVPGEWLANSACMKGTEMKYLKARVFAVLTYELRQYFAATENLIKDHLFKYNPHQTMTMNEPTLLARLREVTKQMDISSESRFLSVMHIIDFSKWNLRMKFSNTAGVFRTMDDFLGTPTLISMSHILFSGMKNIIQDAFHPPHEGVEKTESEVVWTYHNRGWEGQRQKGWTMLTSALLSDLERRTGVTSLICGQGDNQTLLSMFKIPEDYRNADEWLNDDPVTVRRILDDFYNLLSSECSSIGLKVKTGESCRSLCYFNYGKRLFFKGIELSMVLKRISKVTSEGNSVYPTTENMLKTVMGSSTAAGLFSHPSVIPILINKIAVFLQLYDSYARNPLLGDITERIAEDTGVVPSSMFISRLMKIPPSLGGPSSQCTLDFFFRGHPDPYAAEFALLVLKSRNGCSLSRELLSQALAGDSWLYAEERYDKRALIAAPFSLNLSIPRSATRPISDLVVPALSSYCKNEDLKAIFGKNMDDEESRLLVYLSETTPFSPLICNDIFSRSLPGRKLDFVSSLTSASSLSRVALESRSRPVIFSVQNLEYEQLHHWVMLVNKLATARTSGAIDLSEPHHTFLQKAREISWRCTIEGVTVPHPVEQFQLTEAPYDICSDDCKKKESEHVVFVRTAEGIYNVDGLRSGCHVHLHRCKDADPYVGNSISEGVVQKQSLCLNPDMNWRDSIRLNTLRRWIAEPRGQLDNFMRSIIQSRTDTPMSLLDRATGQPSRLSYNHRAALMEAVKTCSTSSTTNFSSRFYISSNRMGEYSHGSQNYHLPYGPCFLFFTFALGVVETLSPCDDLSNPRTVYHAHLTSKDVPVVYDGSIRMSVPYKNDIGTLSSPSLLFSKYMNLAFIEVGSTTSSGLWRSPLMTPIHEARRTYSHQLIADAAVSEVVRHESWICSYRSEYMSRAQPLSAGDISLIGIQNFIHSLAESIFLLMPGFVFTIRSGSGLYHAVEDCIGALSDKFWGHLANPFLIPRLNSQLVLLCNGRFTENVTQSVKGVIIALKATVSLKVYHMVEDLISGVLDQNTTIFSIRAPNENVVKTLLARFMEIVVLTLPTQISMVRLKERHARIVNSKVHTIFTDQLSVLLSSLQETLLEACEKLGVQVKVNMPKFYLYDTSQVWVDRIRNFPAPPVLPKVVNHLPLPTHTSMSPLREDLSAGDSNRMIPVDICHCYPSSREHSIRTECLLTNTGVLGKSHYRFLEIIFTMQLKVKSVICLGSTFGTEAAAISKMQENEAVYIHSPNHLYNFSNHVAASHIPAEFLIGGIPEKLLNSGSSTICSTDIMLDNTLSAIQAHVSSRSWSGLTYDASSANIDDRFKQRELVQKLCRLIHMVTRDSDFWAILNIFLPCSHEAEIVASVALCFFANVSLVRSSFTRSGSQYYYLVCFNPRLSRVSPVNVPGYCLESVYRSGFGSALLGRVAYEKYPRILLLNDEHIKRLTNVGEFSVDSVQHAFWAYLPGFLSSDSVNITREMVLEDLRSYQKSCWSAAKNSAAIYSKAEQGASMARVDVLSISDMTLTEKIQNLGYRLFKARLLSSLISTDELVISSVEREIMRSLAAPFYFYVKGVRYSITIDSTRFINLTSRYLCEILGYLYLFKFKILEPHGDLPYHRINVSLLSYSSPPSWTLCCQVPSRYDVNLEWKWRDRAMVLCVLLFMTLSERFMFDGTKVSIPNQFLLVSMKAALQDLVPSGMYSAGADLASTTLIWVESSRHLDEVIRARRDRLTCLVVHLTDYIRKWDHFMIKEIHRIPWLGVCPSQFFIVCTVLEHPTNQADMTFPDMQTMSKLMCEKGVIICGCPCSDCNGEIEIALPFGLSSRTLDTVCGWKKFSTVLDRHN